MKPCQIHTLSLPDRYRVIAISDIHGCLGVFLDLLEQVDYRPEEDFLILPGDFFGKGPMDVETLNYIHRLVRTTPRAHALAGNVDLWSRSLCFYSDMDALMEKIGGAPWSILGVAAREMGLGEADIPRHYAAIQNHLLDRCGPALEWLISLPLAIDTPDVLFVHAGVENLPRWQDSREDLVLWQPSFFEARHQVGKWVAAGHLPARNYSEAGYGDGPAFSPERRSIALDGGAQVLLGGCLGALLVEKDRAGAPLRLSTRRADSSSKRTLDFAAPGDYTGFVRVTYLHPFLDILEEGPAFSRVRMHHSGETGLAKNQHITEENGRLCTRFHLSAFAPVRPGEVVSVIEDHSPWLLIRNQAGDLGWVECPQP